MKKKIILVAVIFFSFHTLIEAQNIKKCNTTKLMNYEIENNQEYKKARKENIIINRNFIHNFSTISFAHFNVLSSCLLVGASQ